MKISKKAHYGLQACYYLKEVYPDGSVSAKELEKKIAVSSKYLEQIMRALSKQNIVKARDENPLSIEELAERAKLSKKIVELLRDNGVLEGLPEQNQISFF